ncbi:hypothetical protein M5C97_07690 [Acidovorax sp. NCPPB 3859]|uniref:hypothetical protein n=1 Tax=Paracidovorax avenae TaxID=80867 RepID=UPI000D206B15|nr:MULTISPECIES: hypothetical protein [Comamonadaceae]AVS68340.1 hypothetical protein C8245_24135 [Paracidovorax avenae]MDA8452206.1 hypothetical protein [Acidovorax sp. GBBC 3297]MDA8461652.1 hypothetical protein [Acidovorax sp. GBBC 3333]MDA8466685.1 hypothetical protein [Acidovorax sp. GBBC 3332]MDA8471712.1 hypothetical protein [Acidovorax sp. GBBC 3299]
MRRWVGVVAATLGSVAVHAADGAAHIANADLMAALQNPKASLTAARTPLAFDNGASAKNCLDYSELLGKAQPVETTRNFQIRSEYLLCDSIRQVGGRPFVAAEASATARQAKALYQRLDLRSFPSSLRNRAEAGKHSLKALLPGVPRFDGNAVQVDTPDQFFRLEVVGLIDDGKAGKQDLLVWVTDESKTGTYRGYASMVVHPPRTATGLYTAAAPAR